MAFAAPDVGTGTTYTFSGFTANVLSLEWSGFGRTSHETTHMGTTTARTFMPGDLYDPGQVTMTFQYDADQTGYLTAGGTAATLTVTFPGGSTFAASAFLTELTWSDPLEHIVTGTVTFKLTGSITITP